MRCETFACVFLLVIRIVILASRASSSGSEQQSPRLAAFAWWLHAALFNIWETWRSLRWKMVESCLEMERIWTNDVNVNYLKIGGFNSLKRDFWRVSWTVWVYSIEDTPLRTCHVQVSLKCDELWTGNPQPGNRNGTGLSPVFPELWLELQQPGSRMVKAKLWSSAHLKQRQDDQLIVAYVYLIMW